MEHQVRPDGVAHEASTSYHRLVTELFVCGTQAADALVPGSIPDWYRERLELMLAFVRDYTRPDGLAPQIGDADDGRFLPLGDYGADPRDHRHLFAQAGRPPEQAAGSAAYPEGGYFVLRNGELCTRSSAAATSAATAWAATATTTSSRSSWPMPAARSWSTPAPTSTRRTRPSEIDSARPPSTRRCVSAAPSRTSFGLTTCSRWPDRSRAEALSWDASSFEGRHHGFPGATHTRRIELGEDEIRIRDRVTSPESQELEWTFPLAPGSEERIEVAANGLEFRPEPGWYSPSYGVREPTTFLRARRPSVPGEDTTEIVVRVRA